MEDVSLPERVIHFISVYSGRSEKKISLNTTLMEDLGMDGDEADEFLHEYKEAFKVDMSGFEFDKHFGHEGFSLFSPIILVFAIFYKIYCIIFPKTKPFSVKFYHMKPVTVQDLINAAKVGKWQKA